MQTTSARLRGDHRHVGGPAPGGGGVAVDRRERGLCLAQPLPPDVDGARPRLGPSTRRRTGPGSLNEGNDNKETHLQNINPVLDKTKKKRARERNVKNEPTTSVCFSIDSRLTVLPAESKSNYFSLA